MFCSALASIYKLAGSLKNDMHTDTYIAGNKPEQPRLSKIHFLIHTRFFYRTYDLLKNLSRTFPLKALCT
jgi:hypothetical protein